MLRNNADARRCSYFSLGYLWVFSVKKIMVIPAAGLVHHLDMSERLSFLVLSFLVLLRIKAE